MPGRMVTASFIRHCTGDSRGVNLDDSKYQNEVEKARREDRGSHQGRSGGQSRVSSTTSLREESCLIVVDFDNIKNTLQRKRGKAKVVLYTCTRIFGHCKQCGSSGDQAGQCMRTQ